jgi:hypothetical protein
MTVPSTPRLSAEHLGSKWPKVRHSAPSAAAAAAARPQRCSEATACYGSSLQSSNRLREGGVLLQPDIHRVNTESGSTLRLS